VRIASRLHTRCSDRKNLQVQRHVLVQQCMSAVLCIAAASGCKTASDRQRLQDSQLVLGTPRPDFSCLQTVPKQEADTAMAVLPAAEVHDAVHLGRTCASCECLLLPIW
jgi:hypothetical protein